MILTPPDSRGARVSRITLYPVKSLDGVDVAQAWIGRGGPLEHDREWSIRDAEDRPLTARRCPAVHRVRTAWDAGALSGVFHFHGKADPTQPFHLRETRPALEQWLSERLDQPVTLRQNVDGGFPDERKIPGVTITAAATLQAVAEWYGLPVEDIRRRMRANIEVDGVPAFWEDYLVSDLAHCVTFRVGQVGLHGISACGRCAVPTRDPDTGSVNAGFQDRFVLAREAALPPWIRSRERFDHLFRLTTRAAILADQWGRSIRVGDAIGDILEAPLSQVQPAGLK